MCLSIVTFNSCAVLPFFFLLIYFSISSDKSSISNLSKSDIQKDLETAQRVYWEQLILPRVLEVEDSDLTLDKNSKQFILNIKQHFRESKCLQQNVETQIRKKMKKYGSEKRFVITMPPDEIVKGFPEVELKWMFGEREVVLPKALNHSLYHGWKKWRDESKSNLKKKLLENVEQGKQYVYERQVPYPFILYCLEMNVALVRYCLIVSLYYYRDVLCWIATGLLKRCGLMKRKIDGKWIP